MNFSVLVDIEKLIIQNILTYYNNFLLTDKFICLKFITMEVRDNPENSKKVETLLTDIRALMEVKNYKEALKIAIIVMLISPANPIAQQYYNQILQKMAEIQPEKVEQFRQKFEQIKQSTNINLTDSKWTQVAWEIASTIVDTTSDYLLWNLDTNSLETTLGLIWEWVKFIGNWAVEVGWVVVEWLWTAVWGFFEIIWEIIS